MNKLVITLLVFSSCNPAYAGFNAAQEREASLSICRNVVTSKLMACVNAIDLKGRTQIEKLVLVNSCTASFADGLFNCIDTHLKGASL